MCFIFVILLCDRIWADWLYVVGSVSIFGYGAQTERCNLNTLCSVLFSCGACSKYCQKAAQRKHMNADGCTWEDMPAYGCI